MIDTERCWAWPGAHRPEDGRARFKGRSAARWMWEMAHGTTVADNADVHHTCETTWCVNPWHLVVVDRSEHAREHAQALRPERRKAHCVHGHALDNAREYVRPDGRVERVCRECNRLRKQ